MSDITDLVPAGELTDKELRFIDEYLIDCNGTRAASAAGYEGTNIRIVASRLLQKLTISRILAERRKQLSDERHITVGIIIDNLMETYSRAMQQEAVLEWDSEKKEMAPSGEWQFDGKTATRSMELVAKMLGYIDSKTKPGEGSVNGFTLNIITRAAQLEMKQAGLTLDGVSTTVKQNA